MRATIRELVYPTKNTLRGWYLEYEHCQDLSIGSGPRPPKFSEAQKQAALEHYASRGRCISWMMRALGHPGRATLTAWVRAAFPETRSVSCGTRGRGDHSVTVKQAAVVGLYCREKSAEPLAKRVGVSRPTLCAWKNQFLRAEAPATMRRKKSADLATEIEELECQRADWQHGIRELQIEQDLLLTASDLIKRDRGGDQQGLSNREETMLIVALKNQYRLSMLLMRLRLARSSYFYHRAHFTLEDKYLPVRHSTGDIFESNHRCYGYRRLAVSLTRHSISISEKAVRRVMKQEALAVPKPRR